MRSGNRKPRALSLAALASAAIFLVAVAACDRSAPQAATSQPAAGALVVGFAQTGAESEWRTAETRSIRDEARRRGVTLRLADGQGKQGNQIKAIRSFVTQGVDVIVLAPIVSTGWDAALKEARAKNIPVVLVDRGIETANPGLYVTLIASDFVEQGRRIGEWLAARTGGKCNIVELQGTTGSAPAIDRQKGFAQALAAHPGMKVVKAQSANFERARGKEVMEAFLKADRDGFQAVYAHNDDMALGAIQALLEAGKKPGEDVIVVSIDAVRAAFTAMIDGRLAATVECNPLLGPILFDTIDEIRAGGTVPKFIKIEDRLFEAAQARELIDSREY